MSKALVFGITGAAAGAVMFALGMTAGSRTSPAVAGSAEPARAQIETIVRDYLASNPEILIEMQTALELREEERQRTSQVETIRSAADEIFNAGYDGVFGNPEGSVTVVEFFDYNCGYCKRALADMEAMVEANQELRFVLKEFPILGPDSQRAHIVSMAFRNLAADRYPEFHSRLLGGARANEAVAVEIATSLGVDEAALRAEMENPDILQAFASTYELANRLAITGTPSYVIGDEVVFGALGQQLLEQKVALLQGD